MEKQLDLTQAEQQEARQITADEALDQLTKPLCIISMRGNGAQKALANNIARIINRHHNVDQEAQGAQAGDEHDHFEAWHRGVVAGDPPHEKYHDGSYVNQHVNRYWTGWLARAALATQPADGEPIYQWADQNLWMDGDEAEIASARAEGFKTRTLWTAPPAAAHGDGRSDADYAIEHGRYLASAADRFMKALNDAFDPETEETDLHDESFCEARDRLASSVYEFRKRADRAMRAQGDGDSRHE